MFLLNSIEKAMFEGDKQVLAKMEPYKRFDYLSRPQKKVYEINKVFLNNSVFPHSELINKCLKLMLILEVATDGLIFKTKRTNETISKKEAKSEANVNYFIENFKPDERLPNNIPIVNGDIEILEVKSGKSNIPPYQKKNYQEAIKNGFFLRYFHVNIISFNDNHFEIREKLITNPKEVTSFPLGSS